MRFVFVLRTVKNPFFPRATLPVLLVAAVALICQVKYSSLLYLIICNDIYATDVIMPVHTIFLSFPPNGFFLVTNNFAL